MSIKVRERTLYEYIGRAFSKYGCRYVTQVGVGTKEPDLIIEFDGSRVVSEVKIDSEIKLGDAIVDANAKAFSLKTPNAMALLFPRNVRDIPPNQLEKVFPNLEVTSALVLTEWLSRREVSLTLNNLASLITSHYQEWVKTKIPKVSYDLLVDVSRDGISEIASYLRDSLLQEPVFNSAMAVIGRFDIYKSLLEEVSGIPENEAKLYMADIAAYILANQLLFYQIVSEKMGYAGFPEFNPLFPPKALLNTVDKLFDNARSEYSKILGLDLFPLLRKTKDLRIVYSVGRLISKIRMLRPQHIQEDLFGRLYHETIPPETKKNLGAFYTKPEAAKFLATLAIDKWDAKILDLGCGSGTLLVEAYQRKAQLAPPIDKDKLHKKFAKEDIYGIDVMHFAAHMTATNLTSQNIRLRLDPNVFSRDGVEALVNPIDTNPNPSTVEQTLDKWIDAMKGTGIPNDFDVVIMNPPFTRRERIPDEISKLQKIVPEVRGKTGYWAYFVVPADNVIKPNGTQAIVIPEEFFVGRSATSVRKYLIEKGYVIEYLVRSAAEVAFSEAAHYRDYLIVVKKGSRENPLVVSVLKKPLSEITKETESLAVKLKEFASSEDLRLTLPELEALKVETADELVQTLQSNGQVKNILGLCGRTEEGKVFLNKRRPLLDFKRLPWPERDDLPATKYHDFTVYSPNIQMLASFGCPIGCTFCMKIHVIYNSRVYRKRDPKDVVDEMEHVKEKYGANQVYFDDESFVVSKKYVLAICSEIKKRNLKLPFTIMGDTMFTNEDMIKELASAGCIGMKFGVESSDPKVLKNINKPIILGKTKKVVEWCKKYGIISHATYCFGLPGQTVETMRRTLDFAVNLPSDNAQFSIAVPYPGTPFYDYLEKNNYLISKKWEDYDGSRKCVYSYPQLSAEQIEEFYQYACNVYKKVAAKRKIKLAFSHPLWACAKFMDFGLRKSLGIVKSAFAA
jgi:16S rRNA G966 N2-methylase RsmD